MVKWVARLAILAAFLGVVGTVVIISYLHRHRNKGKHQNEIRKEIPNARVAETTNAKVEIQPPTITRDTASPAAETAIVIKKEDTVRPIPPVEKEISPQPVKPPVDKTGERTPIEKVAVKDKSTNQKDLKKHREQNLLNQKELRQVFIQLNRVKGKFSIYSNCVQLFASEQSNNARATRQVESFLRSHHFTIAGRETVPQKVKGIKITPAGECIRVTIGSF